MEFSGLPHAKTSRGKLCAFREAAAVDFEAEHSCWGLPMIHYFQAVANGWESFSYKFSVNPSSFAIYEDFGTFFGGVGCRFCGLGLPLHKVNLTLNSLRTGLGGFSGASSFPRLPAEKYARDGSDDCQYPLRRLIPIWRLVLSGLCFCYRRFRIVRAGKSFAVRLAIGLSVLFYGVGMLLGFAPWGKVNDYGQRYFDDEGWFHSGKTVSQVRERSTARAIQSRGHLAYDRGCSW